MQYTETELNSLVDTQGSALTSFVGVEKGSVFVYRFLLFGGPPHTTPPSSLLSSIPALASVPSVDVDEYQALGVTLQPVSAGAVIRSTYRDPSTADGSSYIADVVGVATAGNNFWFDENDLEARARKVMSGWAGGYSPGAVLLTVLGSGAKRATPQQLAALEFWRAQPPLFAVHDGDVTKLSTYTENVGRGTLGVGFSQGLSDFPSRLVPYQWSTGVTQPQSPVPPVPPVQAPPQPSSVVPQISQKGSKAQNLLLMGAGAVAGYVLFRRFVGRRGK